MGCSRTTITAPSANIFLGFLCLCKAYMATHFSGQKTCPRDAPNDYRHVQCAEY